MGWIKRSKGLQTITSLATGRISGDVYVERTGRLVELQVVGLVSADQAHGFTALVLPRGYRPNRTRIIPQAIHLTSASAAGQRSIIGPGGDVRFFAVQDGVPLYLQCMYLTDEEAP